MNAAYWQTPDGTLWLFGGKNGDIGNYYLGDLWKYANGVWTWMSGSSSFGYGGSAGSKGVFSLTNAPPALTDACSASDGNLLYLYGGFERWSASSKLWVYNTTSNMWAWLDDSLPSRRLSSCWVNRTDGSFYVFAGSKSFYITEEFWKFNGTKWIRIGNATEGFYVGFGIPDSRNFPTPREGSFYWTANDNSFWLFGGSNQYGMQTAFFFIYVDFNDLWKYDGTWILIKGTQNATTYQGYYEVKGKPGPNNIPPGRYQPNGFYNSMTGFVAIFGGLGYVDFGRSFLNDVWEFDGTNWNFLSEGALSPDRVGVFENSLTSSLPGRFGAAGWLLNGNAIIYGGFGYSALPLQKHLGDMWQIDFSSFLKIPLTSGQPVTSGKLTTSTIAPLTTSIAPLTSGVYPITSYSVTSGSSNIGTTGFITTGTPNPIVRNHPIILLTDFRAMVGSWNIKQVPHLMREVMEPRVLLHKAISQAFEAQAQLG